jgi:hypothetical protein
MAIRLCGLSPQTHEKSIRNTQIEGHSTTHLTSVFKFLQTRQGLAEHKE